MNQYEALPRRHPSRKAAVENVRDWCQSVTSWLIEMSEQPEMLGLPRQPFSRFLENRDPEETFLTLQ
jgi:hypothetical protein